MFYFLFGLIVWLLLVIGALYITIHLFLFIWGIFGWWTLLLLPLCKTVYE